MNPYCSNESFESFHRLPAEETFLGLAFRETHEEEEASRILDMRIDSLTEETDRHEH